MTGHPCHQLMHIYNLNVGKDGMSRWRLKNIGEKPVSLKNERTFDFFKKLTTKSKKKRQNDSFQRNG